MKLEIPMIRKEFDVISPELFLKLTESEKLNINEVKVIPPKLGENNFGKILVTYKTPIYKTLK